VISFKALDPNQYIIKVRIQKYTDPTGSGSGFTRLLRTMLVVDTKGEEEEGKGRDRPLTATETRKLAREWRARQGSVFFLP